MLLLSVFATIFLHDSAHAYVGPGLGLGVMGVVLSFLFSILLAVFAIIWVPIKRLFNRLRRKWEQR